MAMYIVWRKMGKTVVEAGRFTYRAFAVQFMSAQAELYKSSQFQVTKVGETPVWD